MTLVLRQRGRRRRLDGAAAIALLLMSTQRVGAPGLARRLGVSAITAKRIVAALRRAGHDIASVRTGRGAFYEVRHEAPRDLESDPLFTTRVAAADMHPEKPKAGDEIYDDT